MVDEIRLGFLVALLILITITIVGLSSFKPYFMSNVSPSIIKDSPKPSETVPLTPSNPERILEDAYKSTALEEIERCLGDGYDHVIDKPFCVDNMLLLKKSCENPQTYIQECQNEIFKSYLKRNVI